MTNIQTDAVSRNRMVSEVDKNFFVEAGAGSGKTTMLVSRMAAMVEAGIDISKICAITFTKAAAGEFYDRFQKILIERSNPDYVWTDKGQAGQLPKPTDVTRERCAQALQNIDLCFMGTIDSFCSMVLSEHPSEAKIPSDASIMSDDDAQVLYKQIYVEICEGKHGDSLKKLARQFRTLYWNAEQVFVAGMDIFMNNRNVHFNFNKGIASDIDKMFAADRDAVNKALKCLMEHPELKYEGNKDSDAAWNALEVSARKLSGRWSSNFGGVISGLKALENLRILPQAMDKYAPSLSDCFRPGGKKGLWLEFIPSASDGTLSKFNEIRYGTTMTFLSECIPVIEKAMKDKGAMTFFDYLYYLREMLKNDAAGDGKLIRYIYERHSYFLIDEFQDTNPMQAEVFFYLTAKTPVEQWSACVPRPGSLFIVGDPKQSIYRFRSADVTSFLKVKKLFKDNGGDILYLSRNFRSTKRVIEYFNEVFPAMLPEETENQSKYEEIPLPDNDSPEFQGIYSYAAYTGGLAEEHPGETDPYQIGKIISGIVGRKDLQVSSGDGVMHPVRYSDIMVITYGKKKIKGIMEVLDAAGIPMRVEGKVPFESNEALYQIYLLYRAVSDTGDRKALFDALKGDLFGTCEEEMMKFRMAGGEISLIAENNLSDEASDTAKKVAGYIGRIKELADKASGLSPAALFSEIMDSFKVYEIAKAENLEVLYYTLELLRNAERTGLIVSLKDGAGYIGTLLAGESDEERCLSLSDNKDCVHIANLHKVKGLEAPVVILAAAVQFAGSSSTRIVHGDNGSEGYIFSLESEKDADGRSYSFCKTDKFENEKKAEDEALKAERDRLIYVGATRVRNTLVICDSISKGRSGDIHKSIWKNLLAKSQGDILTVLSEGNTANNEAGNNETGNNAAGNNAVGNNETGNNEAENNEAGNNADVEEPANKEADVSALYDKAAKECILNDRKVENPTFTIENPSKARLSSKLAEEENDILAIPVLDDAGRKPGEQKSEEQKPGEQKAGEQKSGEQKPEEQTNTGECTGRTDAHRFPTLLGTMTHRLMEIMVSTKNTFNTDEAIDEIIREYSTPQNRPFEDKLKNALKSVADRMQNGGYDQENTAPKDILSVLLGADEVYCEAPFCYRDEADGKVTVWNGVMDVIYCEKGNWHIIDYKTNMDGTNLDVEYRTQLAAYKKAFKAITGNEADAHTYHIDI